MVDDCNFIVDLKGFQRKYIMANPSYLPEALKQLQELLRENGQSGDVTPREYLYDMGMKEEEIIEVLDKAGLV